MQLPIGAESDFKGVVDLIEMNALVWRNEELGAQWDVVEIPADLKDRAVEYREKMVEHGRRNGRRRDRGLPQRRDAGQRRRSAG